jgi:isoleucyl-tRNA synthetase
MRGKDLEGAKVRHPWLDREVPIVLADYVTLESGTGLVHTAPGHGHEDYQTGLKYGLDVYAPVDGRGRFTDDVPQWKGERVFDADPKIVEHLRMSGRLIASAPFVHSYPHCWRCKNPIIFRATEQWFIGMERANLRQRALDEIDRVRWVPPWGRDRIHGMIATRPDWCISRQRDWGVPIVALFCETCGTPHATRAICDHVAAIFEREGADAWFKRPVEDLVPPGSRCECGGTTFRRETDILDVWFDSGSSWAAVVEKRPELGGHADMYLEGSDQHRGWFHSSLLTRVAVAERAPYDVVLTHGFTLDGQGRKMSKSAMNALAPEQTIKKHGADLIRLWVASEDYRDDVRISDEIFTSLSEAYRRVRNTVRFLLSNLYDFDPARHAVPYAALPELERWALQRTHVLATRARAAYEAYEFHVIYHALNNFCAVDLSSLYLDVRKDRLYCERADGGERRATQTVLHAICDALLRIMAPVLSFTAEEAWRHLPGATKAESVFLAGLPECPPEWNDAALAARYDRLLEVRAEVTKALEEARKTGVVKQANEMRVTLEGPDDLLALARGAEELRTLFLAGEVVLAAGPALRVGIDRATGDKCERCWYVLPRSTRPEHPTICVRCAGVIP